jgi:hypothetical protein
MGELPRNNVITGHKFLRDFENYMRVEKEGTIINIVDQVNETKFWGFVSDWGG